ncbi:alkanal monooxygenase [Pseudomonas sp. Pc102]|uniref:LLM class flavin-dependent oxidoreductase n=1 Tax=Pseudomonas sp. Pc102 TaxID=2678261 RepID=UPI001BCD6D8B|nr:LLM class flavin-dependent oxidoreductase [Pseudomonas sp. Pc102]BBP83439.1 alkanal monooxygenase [Pseudomonas sp. Pc102]
MSRRSFSLGFLNRVYSPLYDRQVYQNALELFRVAEALGFDSGWVAQHHLGCETGRLPSPLPLLAAAAQRTSRIRLGTGIVVLPHEPALRLAEDAATLDLLADGRLQLGLGAGFDPDSFSAFGQPIGERHELYDDRLQQLQNYLAGAVLNDQGQALNPPAAGLGARLWEATSRVEQVAERGNGLIVAPNPHQPSSGSVELIHRYRDAWLLGHGTRPRVALVRAIFPGVDASDPDSSLRQDISRYLQRQRSIGVYPGDDGLSFAEELNRLGVLYGDSEGIVRRLAQGARLQPDDHLVVQVQTSSTGLDEAIHHLERIASEIAPALGWQPHGTASAPQPTTATA